MTVYADMDKSELYLAQLFEGLLHKQFNKPLQEFGLLPKPTSSLVKISCWRYMISIPAVFALSTPFAWFGIRVYLVHMILSRLSLHRIERHLRPLLHVVFDPSYVEFLLISCISLMPVVLWTGYLCLSISAWNRRADCWSREAILPPPVAAEMPGVWPPPPVVSGDKLPKI